MSALHIRGRDALPHHAGADDAGRRDLSRRYVGRGRRSTFLLRSCRKNTFSSARLTGEPNSFGELLGLHLAGRFDIEPGRAEHHLQRRERRRVVAFGLLLDVRAGRRAEEAKLGFADLRSGPAQRSRSRRNSCDFCSARIMRIAAASSCIARLGCEQLHDVVRQPHHGRRAGDRSFRRR